MKRYEQMEKTTEIDSTVGVKHWLNASIHPFVTYFSYGTQVFEAWDPRLLDAAQV